MNEQENPTTEKQIDDILSADGPPPTPPAEEQTEDHEPGQLGSPIAPPSLTPDLSKATQPADDLSEEEEPLVYAGMNWFVLRVASNKEDYVRQTLLSKIKIEGFTNLVNRIMVPTEKEKTIKGGKQKIIEKKLYPGYVFVEMRLENDGRIPQDVFFLIKETTGVGDFIGTAGRPSPMSIPEIEKMQQASKPAEEQPTVKMEFAPGDHVKITGGPFENMEATVDELLPDQGKVRVVVTIFGRATPVELEYWLIEKFEE
ncbi:transcription termination/antitermination protein NusG [Poriferisphaera sp. WC338]|uniref:transcription termination/antitermination protein NusG n=1 Tax=Poriferisphaera sp. WC338 TaxID=3425129 RepID=UPI003D8155A8